MGLGTWPASTRQRVHGLITTRCGHGCAGGLGGRGGRSTHPSLNDPGGGGTPQLEKMAGWPPRGLAKNLNSWGWLRPGRDTEASKALQSVHPNALLGVPGGGGAGPTWVAPGAPPKKAKLQKKCPPKPPIMQNQFLTHFPTLLPIFLAHFFCTSKARKSWKKFWLAGPPPGRWGRLQHEACSPPQTITPDIWVSAEGIFQLKSQ